MKGFSIKKAFITIIISLISITSLFALSPFSASSGIPLSFTFDLDLGLLNGSVSEYVFYEECENTDHMVSRLDWDVQNIPYFELSAKVDGWKYLFIGAEGKIAIPKSSGNMQDYDWLNSIGGEKGMFPSWKNESPFELTNYSKHNNKLLDYYTFNFAVGGNILIPSTTIKITPFLSYDYWFISFDGYDGYKDYKSENHVIKTYSGSVISYKQEYQSFMLGTTVSGTFFNRLYLDGTLMLSPMMVYNVSIDNHKARNDYFIDVINNAFEVKAEIQAKYLFNDLLKFGLKSSIQYIPVSKGFDYVNPTQKNGKFYLGTPEEKTQGGTSSLLWTFSLNCALTF